MIRAATPADRSRLRAIQLVALDEPWDGLLGPSIEGPATVLVSTDDGEPVGYAVAIPDDESAYLAELAVAPVARREGRGSALIDRLCSRLVATDIERLWLTVAAGDRGARAFYDAQGFRVHSLIPHHYDSGDALKLVRSL